MSLSVRMMLEDKTEVLKSASDVLLIPTAVSVKYIQRVQALPKGVTLDQRPVEVAVEQDMDLTIA